MSSLKIPIPLTKAGFPKIQQVQVVSYNPDWVKLYQSEAERFGALLGEDLVRIEHAGSTSVAGLAAKPIIDLLVIVKSLQTLEKRDPVLIEAGYQSWGEWGIRERRFYTRVENGVRTHNFHVFQEGHIEIERMLYFRDYLRSHPETAQAYAQLKRDLSQQFEHEIDRYTEAKTEFIESVIQEARKQTSIP